MSEIVLRTRTNGVAERQEIYRLFLYMAFRLAKDHISDGETWLLARRKATFRNEYSITCLREIMQQKELFADAENLFSDAEEKCF